VNDPEEAQEPARRQIGRGRTQTGVLSFSTTKAPHKVAVTMKPLPSATMTAAAGRPCSARFSKRANRSGGTSAGFAELDGQETRDRREEN